ncbi:MAG: AzlC family ABC transporter permease [Clostridiaceae bacterium]
MKNENAKILTFRDGIIAAFPIVIGYIPVAIAFGILSKTVGISILDTFLFSTMVYAGASQFMALNLLHLGTGYGEIILTTLLVNLRHFLMSASFSTKITKEMKRYIPMIAFGITDEFFSVASFKEGKFTKVFILIVEVLPYLSWVLGSVFGYLVGQVLPNIVKDSMGIALYALFVVILIPEARKSNKVLSLALFSGALNTLLNYLNFLPQGWNIVLSIISISALGSYISREREVVVCE